MRISVVIPVFNAAATIRACFDSLASQQRLPDEVVFVDNNSTDNCLEIARELAGARPEMVCVFEREATQGPAAARNRGITAASGEIIAFIDADCVAAPDWVAAIEREFAGDAGLDGLGGVVTAMAPKGIIETYAGILRPPAVEGVAGRPVDWTVDRFIPTLNAAYRREALVAVGAFDESFFPAGEDVDLFLRALRHGCKLKVMARPVKVMHRERQTFRTLLTQTCQYRKAEARIAVTHFRKRFVIAYLDTVWTGAFPLTVYAPRGSETLTACVFLAAVVWVRPFPALAAALIAAIALKIMLLAKASGVRVGAAAVFPLIAVFIVMKIVGQSTKLLCSLRYRILYV